MNIFFSFVWTFLEVTFVVVVGDLVELPDVIFEPFFRVEMPPLAAAGLKY